MEYRRWNLFGLPGEDHGGENLAGDGDARLGTGDLGTGDRSIVGLGMAHGLDLLGDCALGEILGGGGVVSLLLRLAVVCAGGGCLVRFESDSLCRRGRSKEMVTLNVVWWWLISKVVNFILFGADREVVAGYSGASCPSTCLTLCRHAALYRRRP